MEGDWQRIFTRKQFVDTFADKVLAGGELRFIIHSTGRISGRVGNLELNGEWYWEDGFFCRTAMLDGQALEPDCEIIESRGDCMRYTRQKGRGASSIVVLGQASHE